MPWMFRVDILRHGWYANRIKIIREEVLNEINW
jgi:hypothetical protein